MEKKVSEFPGRKADQPKPDAAPDKYLGGEQGSFERPPCGSCIHWKRIPQAGMDQGACMMMPPTGFPIPGKDGRFIGQALSRPQMVASFEGCDQHEDEEGNTVFGDDDDGGGVVAERTDTGEVVNIKVAGG